MTKNTAIIIIILLILTGGFLYFRNYSRENIPININTIPQGQIQFLASDKTFTFNYNPLFQTNTGDKNSTLDWKLNTEQKGILLANVFIPKSYMPGTNFSDAHLTVGISNDKNAIKNCKSVGNAGNGLSETDATISGYSFKKFTFSGAGAGNFYETTSYRGIVDGDCYAIEYTIHSTNIGNYPPELGIKKFDKNKIQSELENIVHSFKFTINSN